MKVTVFNLKGGQGKTTLSLAFALSHGFLIVTNDEYSPIDKILPKGHVKFLRQEEALPTIPQEVNVIYDFGGYPDKRITTALSDSHWVIVPVIAKSPLDIQVTIKTVREIEKYNKNIVLVVNLAKKGQKEEVKKIFDDFFSYPLFEVRESTAFVKMVKTKKSLEQLMEENRLFRYHYKEPLAQIQAIKDFIS